MTEDKEYDFLNELDEKEVPGVAVPGTQDKEKSIDKTAATSIYINQNKNCDWDEVAENIPNEMKRKKQWNLWILYQGRKIPVDHVNGIWNSIDEETGDMTYFTFEECINVLKEKRIIVNGGFQKPKGLFFRLKKEDNLCFLDADKVVYENGIINEQAEYFINQLDSYTELSQSGKGLHVICKCNENLPALKISPYEIYFQDRWIAVTGFIQSFKNELKEKTDEVKQIYDQIKKMEKKEENNPQPENQEHQEQKISGYKFKPMLDKIYQHKTIEEIIISQSCDGKGKMLCPQCKNTGSDGKYNPAIKVIPPKKYKKDGIEKEVKPNQLVICQRCKITWNALKFMQIKYNTKKALYELYKLCGIENKFKEDYNKCQENAKDNSSGIDYPAIAREFRERQPYIFDNESKIFYVWDKQKLIWRMASKQKLMKLFDVEFGEGFETFKADKEQSFLREFEKKGYLDSISDIEPMPDNLIQFNDQIVDINTMRIMPPSASLFVTNYIPWSLGDSDETPIIDNLFSDWVGEDKKQMLYEFAAFALLRKYPIARIICLLGGDGRGKRNGSNGKNTFMRFIQWLVGKINFCSTNLSIIRYNQFATSALYLKQVCWIDEMSGKEINDTTTIKRLVGEGDNRIEFKGKKQFEYPNTAKLFITTNTIPECSDTSDGWFRRWVILEFPNRFEDKGYDILKNISDYEMKNFCRKLIPILRDLLRRGGFTGEGSIEQRRDKYLMKADLIGCFVNDFLKIGPEYEINKEVLLNDLNEWLRSNRKKPKSSVALGKWMKENGYDQRKSMDKRYYLGLGYDFEEKGPKSKDRALSIFAADEKSKQENTDYDELLQSIFDD